MPAFILGNKQPLLFHTLQQLKCAADSNAKGFYGFLLTESDIREHGNNPLFVLVANMRPVVCAIINAII
jgi:hypothetical protein